MGANHEDSELRALIDNDKEALRKIYLREMAQIDYNSAMRKAWAEGYAEGLAEAKAEGKAEGIALGKAEGKAEVDEEIARKLLKLNIPLDQIAGATGLTHEEIERLQFNGL